MSNSFLCGGVFLFLLDQVKLRTQSSNGTYKSAEGHSNPIVLRDLIYVFTDSRSFGHAEKDGSEYRNCKIEGSINVPFNDSAYISTFNSLIHNEYNVALSRMTDFTHRHLNNTKKDWIVKVLLQIIADDVEIDHDDLFYANPDGRPVSKDELISCSTFYIDSFLLGVLHYILMNRAGKNQIGIDTLNAISSKRGNGRTYTGNLVERSKRDINVLWDAVSDHEVNESTEEVKKQVDSKDIDLSRLLPRNYERVMNTPISEIEKLLPRKEDPYFKKAYAKYSSLKTLLYNNEPHDFYSFYECNNLLKRVRFPSGSSFTYQVIKNITIKTLREHSKYIILTGTGGQGKSMMMRHLLLDTLENRQHLHLIPIFVAVKNYNPDQCSLIDFIYQSYKSIGGEMDYATFSRDIESGNYVFLFDGLDEIKSAYTEDFNKEIEALVDSYPANTYIASSRPYTSFLSYQKFTVLEVASLEKDQALSLIHKLEFRPDEPAIKEAFINELKDRLFYTHHEFCSNPLLLTIMLMTYEQFAEIPSKMHVFYREAYITLFQRHDAGNKGGFRRAFKTGLNSDQFEKLFSEFCTRTYVSEQYEFSEEEFKEYYTSLRFVDSNGVLPEYNDFVFDITNNVCLMYFEGGKYCFTHRSFQEYFTALFFSRQKDRTLKTICYDIFNHEEYTGENENTFDMLYDMIPEKIDEFVFLVFLEELLSSQVKSYWDYLKYQYPSIMYKSEDYESQVRNLGYSFLLRKICVMHGFFHNDFEDMLPDDEDFHTMEYVFADEHYDDDSWLKEMYYEGGDLSEGNILIVPWDDVSSYYDDVFGEPAHAGWELELSIHSLIDNPDKYKELRDIIDSDEFPLKKEYRDLLEDYENMKKAKAQSLNSDEWFDQFF